MQVFASNLQMELQQRGSEYSQLFLKYDNLRPALLERMPPLEVTQRQNTVQEMTNGEQTPSPSSGDETSMPETDSAQDSVSHLFVHFCRHFERNWNFENFEILIHRLILFVMPECAFNFVGRR